VLLEQSEPQSELGAFLKMLRHRVAPESSTLGPYERLASRYGRRVSQEELAEAVGVTRGWYRMLESGASVRASMQLLDRLAEAFALATDERRMLFTLAVPEMRSLRFRGDSQAVLDAFSYLRPIVQRLWVTTSEIEAYSDVCARIANWFDDAAQVHWMRRDRTGEWEGCCLTDKGSDLNGILQDINASLRVTGLDNLMLYPVLHQAGAVGRSSDLPFTTQQARIKAYSQRGLTTPEFIHARVHSRSGLIGGFSVVREAGRSYSETDHAVLGALAELTSLALL
jgi:transcriptional regulator with XRE-family HTH domain